MSSLPENNSHRIRLSAASPVVDLFLLNSGDPHSALLVARCAGDVVTARLGLAELREMGEFRNRLRRAVLGLERAPGAEECYEFGRRLHEYLFQGEAARFYARLPQSHVRMQLLVNHAGLADLPWEFLAEPRGFGGPIRNRSLARLVPAQGHLAPVPRYSRDGLRVLLVTASPPDQFPVDSESARLALEFAFRQYAPAEVSLVVVEAATRRSLRQAIARHPFDVLHFIGHGDVSGDGTGRLVLIDARTRRTDYIRAPEVARLVAGLPLRLVILSACESAAGDFHNDFGCLAAALVRCGIPAVVANQLPIPNTATAPFVAGMYSALLQHGDIDRAVVEGRIALAQDLNSFEWAIPVLYRHYEATHLFQGGMDD